MANTGQRGTLYTASNNSFYQVAGEDVITVIDTSGNISQLQTNINQTRAANPNKLIIIRMYVGQTYNITTNALTLSSNMVIHGLGANIVASPSSTASELIKITDNSTNVSICNLTLDRAGRSMYNLQGTYIDRCNFDSLTALDGNIEIICKTPVVYNNEITITRCKFTGSATRGINILYATQALLMDNTVSGFNNGIYLTSCQDSTIINNLVTNNAYGVVLDGCVRCSIANNTFLDNSYGINLSPLVASTFCKIVSNRFNDGIYDSRISNNTIYDNDFSSGGYNSLASSSSRIITTSTVLNAPGTTYFYPPTITNRHSSAIKNGVDRTNITNSDTTLNKVLTAYRAAKAANPNHVIVMNLTAPVITGNETITLSSNSCFILSGSINFSFGLTPAFSGRNVSYVSFSGGTFNAQNLAGVNGIVLESCSYALIDQVTFNNFGPKFIRTLGSEPILLEGCTSPVAVGYCTVNQGSARGIWIKGGTQSTNNLILTDNTLSNLNMDGIDLDVTCTGMLAKFNNCNDNVRYGMFIEEGASSNQVLANSCSGNEIGLNVFSNTTSNTRYNSLIANKSISNERGIRFGAASTRNTSNNFAFNNSIISCTSGIDAQSSGSENYCSQNYLYNNTLDISNISSAVFFNSPFLTLIAARINSNGVYQTVNYFDEITYATNKIGYTAVYSAEFDEITLKGSGGGLGKRETSDGKVYVTGSFDEVTPIV
jgi:parallel beta-helix repeat protein